MIPKFRVWDKKEREMCDVVSLDWEYEIVEGNNGYEIWPRGFFEVELMQSTGLIDKNGVEIYEGDIVEVLVQDDFPKIVEDGTYIGVVGYKQGTFDIKSADNIYLGIIPEMNITNINCIFEILGNRYEHPELLEDN